MSELSNHVFAADIRKALLATTSVAVLSVLPLEIAAAKDSDRPTLWLEGGWHYEAVSGNDDPFDPPFTASIISNGFTAPTRFQNPTAYSYGAEGGIFLRPQNSDWTFSVTGRYGRSGGKKTHHEEQQFSLYATKYGENKNVPATYNKFVDTQSSAREQHVILDFKAGKDVGVGLISPSTVSSFNLGVRFAQFISHSNATIAARPDFKSVTKYLAFAHGKVPFTQIYNRYDASIRQQRSFHGVGPSISWNSSTPLIGDTEAGELSLDLGANAAVLFGRQKANGDHEMRRRYYHKIIPQRTTGGIYTYAPVDIHRSRSVAVPNVGAFAGVSYGFSNAKLNLGYRADFFFGAMDGGVDSRHTHNSNFYGPFANMSIGLGP